MTNKLQIIEELYKACYGNASYLDIGADLAYTIQAVISNMKCELNPVGPFVRLLKEKLPDNHMIWNHIRLEPTVLCINCASEILWDQASFCPPLDGWLGHNCCIDAGDEDGYYEEVVLT